MVSINSYLISKAPPIGNSSKYWLEIYFPFSPYQTMTFVCLFSLLLIIHANLIKEWNNSQSLKIVHFDGTNLNLELFIVWKIVDFDFSQQFWCNKNRDLNKKFGEKKKKTKITDTRWFFSLVPPLKFPSIEKLIYARLGVSRTIYVNVDSPNLGFPQRWKKREI